MIDTNGIYILIFILVIGAYGVSQIIAKIIQQRKHLDDETLTKVAKATIKYEPNYDAAIAHLGICRKCEERLHEISREI